jgi:hypothetical protein
MQFRMVREGFCAPVLVVCVLCLNIIFFTNPAYTQHSADEATPTTAKKPELVFDSDCVEVVKPGHDFQLHVPIDKNGEPLDALIYTTGKLDVKVKAPGCAKVEVRADTAAKSTGEDGKKMACCDSHH